MAGLVCTSTGSGDFSLQIDATVYACTADTAPILLVENGGLSQAEFNELWPLLLLMIVTAFGLFMVRRMFA
jgi:hypothetical protein